MLNLELLLKEICDYYQHTLILGDDVVCISDCGEENTFPNVEECLIEWLPTLAETNISLIQSNQPTVWSLEKINVIMDLKLRGDGDVTFYKNSQCPIN